MEEENISISSQNIMAGICYRQPSTTTLLSSADSRGIDRSIDQIDRLINYTAM